MSINGYAGAPLRCRGEPSETAPDSAPRFRAAQAVADARSFLFSLGVTKADQQGGGPDARIGGDDPGTEEAETGKHRLTDAYAWFLAGWAKRLSWQEVAAATSWDRAPKAAVPACKR